MTINTKHTHVAYIPGPSYKLEMSLPAKKTLELFYDVVSPYSWIAFEVCRMAKCRSGNQA